MAKRTWGIGLLRAREVYTRAQKNHRIAWQKMEAARKAYEKAYRAFQKAGADTPVA